jgi:hypothetical protein
MAYTTAIRGLSAQGINAFTGMCYSNNDVSFTMTSTEFANAGFKYVIEVADPLTGNEYKFYISPNAVGSGVFNAKTIFNQLVTTGVTIPDSDDVILQISDALLMNDNLVRQLRVRLFEGYDVAGVFTEDESVMVIYDLMCVYGKGKSNFLVMGSNETKPIALSQCYDNTIGFNAETVATRINIPTSLQSQVINWQRISRSNVLGAQDSAYKILSWIADDGTIINQSYPYVNIANFRYVLWNDAYTQITTFDIPMEFLDGALLHIPAGLKNLYDGSFITQAQADDTIFWTIVGVDGSNVEVTAKYGFYIDEDCKYNPVHVYWLNQLGGWDSYSFIKKNERSIDVEKKRYKTYLGNYNTADVDNPFDTKNYSRSLNEREPITKTFLNLTSDWLTESEYKWMRDLFYSKSVWMVDDNVDGFNILPVVVEDTNYLMKRERNSKKYNQTLRLQLANEYDTININAYEYPLPDPNACTLVPSVEVVPTTTKIVDISPTPNEFPIVLQGVNWGTNGGTKYNPKFWNVNHLPDDPNGLVTGQTYRVEITLSVAMSGSFYFSFGRFASAPSYNGWDWVLNGALTTTQVNDLVWNPYNLSGSTGVYAIISKAGLPFPGYNGTITINVYSGTCP